MESEVNSSTRCSPSGEIVARDIEGQTVIIPLTAGVGDADDELYTLNETGQAIWRLLDGQKTLAEVAAVLASEFSVAKTELQDDVVGFARELVCRGILTTK